MSDEKHATLNKLTAQVAMLRYLVLLLCKHILDRREITKLVEGLTGPLAPLRGRFERG